MPTEWKRAQRQINKLVERIRDEGYRWKWAYSVERNPQGTGGHVHGWQHGDFVPQAQLQELSHSVGLGIPYIERIRQPVGRGSAVGYGIKGVGYGMKSEDLEEFLDLNGSRLVHASHGFWRDGEDGERLTLEGAKRAALTGCDDEGPWVVRRAG